MWKTARLGDICQIQPPKKEVFTEHSEDTLVTFMGMNLLGINQKYSSSGNTKVLSQAYKSYQYFRDNDVLLAKITPCFENGKLSIARDLSNGVGFGSSEFIVLRAKEFIETEYLYYVLLQPSFRERGKKNMSGAVGQKRVAKKFIENYLINLPPLEQQRRIVAKLDAVFAEIDVAVAAVKRKQEQVDSLKNALLSSELSPAAIDAAKWKTAKLGELCVFTRGLTYSKKDEVDVSNTAVLRATNIDLYTRRIKLDEIRYISDTVAIKKDKIVRKGDILICTASGSKSHLGKVALAEVDFGMAFGGFIGAIRTTSTCRSKFLFAILTSSAFVNHLCKLGDGANINNLRFSQVENFEILLPPLVEQQRIVAKLDAVFEQADVVKDVMSKQLANYQALKSALLSAELTGEAA